MGFTCSLLGHQFGETERVEEREEKGSEVVVTIKEVEQCVRCEHAVIVSESKEVTAIETAFDDVAGSGSDEEDDASESSESSDPTAAADTAPGGFAVESEATVPAEDDGVVLETEGGERRYGEWPAKEEEPEPESAAEFIEWPEVEGEDEGFSASDGPSDDDATVGFDGLTPEVSDVDEAAYDGAELIESETGGDAPADQPIDDTDAGDDDVDDGFARAGPAPAVTADADEVDTEYYCPRCAFEKRSVNASVRPGDICPSCHRGYLAERPLE